MRYAAIMILALGLAAPQAAADRKLVASDIPGARLKTEGRLVIEGDGSSVRAYQVDGNLRKQLIRIQSSRRAYAPRPFGPEIYDSSARVSFPAPREIASVIAEASRKHGVDPRLVTAVAYRESGFRPDVVSTAGASGIMQLMPKTAEFLGVDEIFDIRQNIFGGVQYLRMLIDTFSGDLDLALAAYNAGPGAVERHRGVPPYRETVEYIRRVRGDYERALGRHPRG
jgi:soluble lytic murein transglycosylase-like protein